MKKYLYSWFLIGFSLFLGVVCIFYLKTFLNNPRFFEEKSMMHVVIFLSSLYGSVLFYVFSITERIKIDRDELQIKILKKEGIID